MKTPFERIWSGAVVLGIIFVVAVAGFRVVGGYGWIESAWTVVVTISTVGFAERSESTAAIQFLHIFVILFGISAAAYTFGGFLQLLLEGEIDDALGRRRMTRGIENLVGHVIVCGYGRIGETLATALHRQNRPFVVVDMDPDRLEKIKLKQLLFVAGDATEETVLKMAGVERANTMFTGLPSDAANVFITLTARNLNPTLQIIARAAQPSTATKLRQAGADRVVMPTLIGAHHVERLITRPSTADLMELMSESSFRDLELDEFLVADDSRLAGVTVQETEAHRRHRLLVVAVRLPDGKMVFNPDATHSFQPGEILMVMGHIEDIQRFRAEFDAA